PRCVQYTYSSSTAIPQGRSGLASQLKLADVPSRLARPTDVPRSSSPLSVQYTTAEAADAKASTAREAHSPANPITRPRLTGRRVHGTRARRQPGTGECAPLGRCRSAVRGPAVDRARRVEHRLGDRRMRVDDPGKLLVA